MIRYTNIEGFEPIALRVADVGPFQGRTEEVLFTTREGRIANFFLLVSKNGQGKTTLLECFGFLMGLLEPHENRGFIVPAWLRDHPNARMQLDLKVSMNRHGQDSAYLLSLFAGDTEDAIAAWTEKELEQVGCSDWHRYGRRIVKGVSEAPVTLTFPEVHESDRRDAVTELLTRIFIAGQQSPGSDLEEPTELAPTLLYFTAERQILQPEGRDSAPIQRPGEWNHRVLRRFDADGRTWAQSIDNLLVWLYWLDEGKGRFKRAQDIVNERIFRRSGKRLETVQKDPPQAIVMHEGSRHRIDQLSSGEKSLLQLFVRIAAHMTRNTIVIVDELDLHLHPSWERRTIDSLKELVISLREREDPIQLILIVSAQSREILDRFDVRKEEPPLIKEGYIIERDFDEDQDDLRGGDQWVV